MASFRADADRYLRTEHLAGDLKSHSVRGAAVTVVAQAVKTALQFGTIVVLARLLTPGAFGLIAMVAAIVTILEMFKDLGLSMATVRRPKITQQQASNLFWLNAGLGLAIAGLTAAGAPLLAWFYGEPALTDITRILGLGFLIGGLSNQHFAILRRQMRFGALAALQVVADVAAMGLAVALAFLGCGYWSLVAQRLAWTVLLAVGSWILCGWRPSLPSRGADTRGLIAFGANVTGSNLANFLASSLDQVLIGWYWGAAPLGVYERAYRLLLFPINNINAPLMAVAFPTLSRLAPDPARYRRAYLAMVERLLMLTMPGAALVIAGADWVVAILLGSQWADATPIVAWFGVAALLQAQGYTLSWLLMSQDRTSEMLRCGFLNSVLTILGIIAGLPFGPAGVAAGLALTGLLLRPPILFRIVGRRGPVTTGDLYRVIGPSAAAAATVLLAIWGLRRAPAVAGLPPVEGIALAIGVALAMSLFVYVALPQSRRALRDLAELRGVLLRRRREAQSSR